MLVKFHKIYKNQQNRSNISIAIHHISSSNQIFLRYSKMISKLYRFLSSLDMSKMGNLQLACLVLTVLVSSVFSTGLGLMGPFEKDSGSKRFRINSFSPMDRNVAEDAGQLRESELAFKFSFSILINIA